MTYGLTTGLSPRMQSALDELQGMIRRRYPHAQFHVDRSPDDPCVIHLIATVDVEDIDQVLDVVVDRMMELQIDEDLPVFVTPVRPVERLPMQPSVHGSALIEEPKDAVRR